MPFEQKLIGIAALFAWTAMWWLAFRAVIGGRIGPLDWLPVAILAFGVPFMVTEVYAYRGWELPGGRLLLLWGGVALVIDAVWIVRRVRRTASLRNRVG